MSDTTPAASTKRVFKLTFWPTVMSVIMVSTALFLGSWQVQRLAWKEAIISDRTARVEAAPIPLVITEDPQTIEDISFRRVSISGTFRHEHELHFLARDSEGRAGYMIVTPLVVTDAPESDPWLMVNRGWVSMDERFPENRPRDPRRTEEVSIQGLVRPAFMQSCLNLIVAQPCFTPENAPQENIWFWSDFPAMEAHVGRDITPFIMEQAWRDENPLERPKAGQMLVHLPNNHLQYAVTWFIMAIVGSVVWFLYHYRKPEDD